MKLRITVDGTTYEADVEVLDPGNGSSPHPVAAPAAQPVATPPGVVPRPAARPAPTTPPPAAAGDGDVASPVAGTVVSMSAQPGQAVGVNDPLLVLEAMKMESTVASPVAGTVREVLVKPGDAVQAGQVLARVS